jgi:hypothetical protein
MVVICKQETKLSCIRKQKQELLKQLSPKGAAGSVTMDGQAGTHSQKSSAC